MVGGTRERQRPWREYFQIATVYEGAAADKMTVPRQQRAAFVRKARWFHMLARIKAAKEAAAVFNGPRALLLMMPVGMDTPTRWMQCGDQSRNI